MLDAHAHVMQVKLCKANTRGVTKEEALEQKDMRSRNDLTTLGGSGAMTHSRPRP